MLKKILVFTAVLAATIFVVTTGRVLAQSSAGVTTDSAPALYFQDIVSLVSGPVSTSQISYLGSAALGTTPTSAGAEVAAADRTTKKIQMLFVTNLHATNKICIKAIAYSTSSSVCSADCAAATITCGTTSATTGSMVLPGAQREMPRFTTNSCVCMVSDSAGSSVLVERVIR